MEAVNAYYDGQAFVPTKPVRAKKNQRAIVTILDDGTAANDSKEIAREAAKRLRGMFEGSDMSSEKYAAQKQFEKELEL